MHNRRDRVTIIDRKYSWKSIEKYVMKTLLQPGILKRLFYRALPLACCLLFLLPEVSEAHAILLRSDPANNAILTTSPTVVHMWFADTLNPTYSTARALNSSQQRVDKNNAHVAANDSTELDVNMPPKLPPAVYVVLWRTQSANDGHILTGSFTFNIANPDGSTQKFNGPFPAQNQLGDIGGSGTGQLDGPALFNLIMITLVELGTVFWVGAQLWRSFATSTSDATQEQEQHAIEQHSEQRFDRIFSLPTLLLIFIANIGVVLGQAMLLPGEQLAQAFSPSIFFRLIRGSNFGIYWSVLQSILILALLATGYTIFVKQRSKAFEEIFSWVNLLLGLALLTALTLSNNTISDNSGVFAPLADWLHWLAAALWIGGVMYIATTYLPVLMALPAEKHTGFLLSVLSRYLPLASTGIILLAVTGPFEAMARMESSTQLLTTAYGRVLLIKLLLVVALLVISVYQLFVLRPKLLKDYKKHEKEEPIAQRSAMTTPTAQEEKSSEREIEMQGRTLINTVRWESLLGIAVLLCTGLLSVFAGTLALGTAALAPPSAPQPSSASAFTTTTKTTDGKFKLTFNVTPNHFGANEFTVLVLDSKGQPDTDVKVSLYNTMEDMDMGTRHLDLQPTDKGHFKGSDQLDMSGHWQVRIDVRTPEGISHATVNFTTPADS